MANTADDYAKWIVANEHLKGTPDFDTVAKAYQEAKAQEAQAPQQSASAPQAAPVEPTPSPSVGDMVTRGATAVGRGLDSIYDNVMAGGEAASLTFGKPELAQSFKNRQSDFFADAAPSASEQFVNSGKEGYNWNKLPEATIEQTPQFAGSLGARAAGAATLGGLGALTGPAAPVLAPLGAAVGALGGPAVFEFVQQVGPTALERARNNGREAPNGDDWAEAAKYAGYSGLMNAIPVQKIPGINSLLGRVLTETATETGQGLVGQLAPTYGTEAYKDKNALELTNLGDAFGEGIIGGTSAGGAHGVTSTAPRAIQRATSDLKQNMRAIKARRAIENNPIQKAARGELARSLDDSRPDLSRTDYDNTAAYGSDHRKLLNNQYNKNAEAIKARTKTLGTALFEGPEGERIQDLLKQRVFVDPSKIAIDDDGGDAGGFLSKLSAVTGINRAETDVIRGGLRSARNKQSGIIDEDMMTLIESRVGNTAEGRELINLLYQNNNIKDLMFRKAPEGLAAKIEPLNILGTVNPFGSEGGTLGSRLNKLTKQAAVLGAASSLGLPAALAVGVGAQTIYSLARASDWINNRRSPLKRFIAENKDNEQTVINEPSIQALRIQEAQINQQAATSEKRAQEAHKETSTRIFREALNAFQSNDPNYAIPDRSWLVENSDYLTDAHYNALEKRIRLNEERAAKDEKDYNKQVEDEFRNRILKDLTDASRGGGRIPPAMLEQYKPFLKPAEYDRFSTRQNVEDKRVIAFAYQMANQKAAQAEADAKKKRKDAEDLKRKNRKDEAEQKLKEAEVAEAKAEQDKADAKAVVDSVLAELARMKLTGTLNYEYINDHVDVLGPKEFAKQLDLLKRQQDAQSKLRKQEATKNSGRRVHRAKRSASAAIPTQTRPAPQPTPAVSAEAIGDPNNPVRSSSPTPSLFATGMNTGKVRVKEAFDNKVDVTEAMQDAILAKAEALKGTDQDDLSFALQTFVELIAGKGEVRNRLGGAKNNPAERFKVFKSAIKSLGDDKEAIREFRRDTEDLMLAFGNPLEGDAMDDYVAWKKDNRDTAP